MKKFLLDLFEKNYFNSQNMKKFLESFFYILEVFKKVQMNQCSYKIIINSLLFVKVIKQNFF